MEPTGPGKVYIMKDRDEYKIGQSVDPRDRLKEVRKTRPKAELIDTFDAKNMGEAESSAHRAVVKMGMKQQGESDWFRGGHVNDKMVLNAVRSAVQSSNDRN